MAWLSWLLLTRGLLPWQTGALPEGESLQPVAVRLVAQVFTMVWLVGCAGWAVQVLWRL